MKLSFDNEDKRFGIQRGDINISSASNEWDKWLMVAHTVRQCDNNYSDSVPPKAFTLHVESAINSV